MIELEDVDFSYPGALPVFKGFNWQIQSGENWAILGPSGCGKSTLLYLLAGLRVPQGGRVCINGYEVGKPQPGTGVVLQDYGLLPWANVRQNVELGLKIRRFYGPDGIHAPRGGMVGNIEMQAQDWLERLGLLDAADQFPGQISGGQRQRTAIARTLALNPELLLLDEPFASLDAPTRQSLQKFVLGLNVERTLTTLIVTHSVEEAALMGDKILVLTRPPIQQARVILNPAGGQEEAVGGTEFVRMCEVLRSEMEAAV